MAKSLLKKKKSYYDSDDEDDRVINALAEDSMRNDDYLAPMRTGKKRIVPLPGQYTSHSEYYDTIGPSDEVSDEIVKSKTNQKKPSLLKKKKK